MWVGGEGGAWGVGGVEHETPSKWHGGRQAGGRAGGRAGAHKYSLPASATIWHSGVSESSRPACVSASVRACVRACVGACVSERARVRVRE